MRHKMLTATTMGLWIINVVYVAAIHSGWPQLAGYDSGQRLFLCFAVVITLAWLLERAGIEYRIGYRHGRQDRHDR